MNSIENKKPLIGIRRWSSACSLCIVAILLLVCAPASHAQDNGIENLRKTGHAFASVAKKASPAVVFIQVEKVVDTQPAGEFSWPFGGQQSPFGNDFFRHFFGPSSPQGRQRSNPPQSQQRQVGQGSGFIISDDGYILTNNHVVGGADKITVKVEDGREFTGRIVGTDPHSDVAVIKIDAKDLPVLPLGDSDALEVGNWVLAIGNPFGLSHSLTAGIVSAKGRSRVGLADYEDFIQTDAAINPGNSGGPLIDLEGKAVGMNTAIFSRSGGYMGIGFAIPINMAKAIKDQLIKTGSVTRGYLGIMIQDLTPELAESFGLGDQKGVLIAKVAEDSPAEKAGLKQGDVIVKFDGEPVKNVGAFRNSVSLKSPETKVDVTVLRNGKSRSLKVTIGKLSDDNMVAGTKSAHKSDQLGITVQTLTPDLAEQFGYQGETGVVITQVNPGSVAAQAGLQTGNLVQEVNRVQVHNVDEFRQALAQSEKTDSVLLYVRDGEYSRYIVLSLGK